MSWGMSSLILTQIFIFRKTQIMKYLFILSALFLISCAGEEEPEQSTQEMLDEIWEENDELVTDFIPKDPPAAGSMKELLLGVWENEEKDLETHLDKDRYVSYVDGRKNWDQSWELTSEPEMTADNQDDNGKYVQVISEEDGDVFYNFEIIELDENSLHGQVVGSSGDGPYDHIYWTRVK